MKVSVILSTYNAPAWLEKVLWGYHCQSHADFELVVADDGSDARTTTLLEQMGEQSGLNLVHVWQRNQGFRKCRILNKAVLHATGDYLIFSDGDCIPRRDFVATHVHRASPGHYLSGSYIKLPMATSEAIDRAAIENGDCFRLAWLRRHGPRLPRKAVKLAVPPALAGLCNRLTTTRCNFKGSNGSAWRDDVLAVNGFDERMPWGGEDREFGVRLRNHGLKPRHVRYDAIVVHLDHARGYVDPEQVEQNKALRQRHTREGVSRTDFGIAQLQVGQD